MPDPRRRSAAAPALLAALLPAALLAGQSTIGSRLPELPAEGWLRGGPVAVTGADAAPCTLFACYSWQPERLAADVGYLAALQQRLERRGLRAVVVVRDAACPGLDAWSDAALLDPDGKVAGAVALADGERRLPIVAVDARGVVQFVGEPGGGLIDEVERVLDGVTDADRAQQLFELRRDLVEEFGEVPGDEALDFLSPLVDAVPRDGLLQGLCYLMLATRADRAEAAAARFAAATEAMADEPRPLAVFADLVLRGDPFGAGLAEALVAPLQRAATATPDDPAVQLALLRALLRAGRGREAGRLAMQLRAVVTGTADGCVEFASLLTQAPEPAIWRDLATMALDAAARLGAEPFLLLALRHTVASRCQNDPVAARRLFDAYLADGGAGGSLNSDAWELMTGLGTMGRFDWFAAALAEQMLDAPDLMDDAEYDTAALAMFLTGRLDRAVELQRTALAKGGAGVSSYEERMRRYLVEQARAASPPGGDGEGRK